MPQSPYSNYPNTGSSLSRMIRSGLSTSITIYVPTANDYPEPVGAIQSLSVTETSGLKRIGETRNPRTFEIIPQGQDVIVLNVRRVVFDGLRLTHALGCSYSHIRSQRWPFDIVVYDRTHGGNLPGTSPKQTWFSRCWFSNYSVDYRADQYLITESATLECEYIREIFPVQSSDNERGLQLRPDSIETSYDEGLESGPMRVPVPKVSAATPSPNQTDANIQPNDGTSTGSVSPSIYSDWVDEISPPDIVYFSAR